jgi:primosomal protein N' (replication factor Y)
MHSRLSPGERYDEWQRLRSGKARVAIGARSAIFAPVENIGLIVIDEEHEGTYRSQNMPRYNAIEVAKKRCEFNNSALVLGSATPSVESYYRAKEGEYHLLEMPKRIGTALMPEVEIVDMREEFKKGNKRVISQSLYDALDTCLERDEQAILFLNRRGHSTFVSCRECGYVCECEFCDLPMTYHKATGKLHCHYCGSIEESPKVCPQCGSEAIRFFGGGTQKIQEQIEELFPNAKTLRMDADTTTAKESHLKILDSFAKREAQILIGTQMIAKGLDYPHVTLVGVIAADTSLYLNDINAPERTFQLVSQVAGRAGRAGLPGRVVVQTYSPEHYAIMAAADHDYKGFYKREIELRRAGLFPPFAHFMRYVISHEDNTSARHDMAKILSFLREQLQKKEHLWQSILMLEGTPAPYHRLRGLYRYQVIIKYLDNNFQQEMEDIVGEAKQKGERQSTCLLELDAQDII